MPREGRPVDQQKPTPEVPAAAPVAVGTLEALEQKLTETLELPDPEAMKESITKCLELVRTEKVKPPAAQPTVVLPPVTHHIDSETGLPGRLLFEKIVSDAIGEQKTFMLALFVVERLPLINKRFGRAAGDRVLLYVAQYLAQELPDSNSLSRWSGTAFSAIITSENSDKMGSQIRAISNKPLSANIDVGSRSVMLTISCGCLMEQVTLTSSAENLFKKMDDFVEARTGS